MNKEKLIETYQRKVDSIKSEIKELSCDLNPHPDDVDLCKKLNIKLKLYQEFIIDLNRIKEN
jgi:DNA-directed RNA polymerase specialized sigma subunit